MERFTSPFSAGRKIEIGSTDWNIFTCLKTKIIIIIIIIIIIVIYFLYIYLQLALEAGDVQITDYFTEEKQMNKREFDFLNTQNIAEVKAKVGL